VGSSTRSIWRKRLEHRKLDHGSDVSPVEMLDSGRNVEAVARAKHSSAIPIVSRMDGRNIR